MGSYRLYFLQASRFAGSEEIEAADDREATRIAERRADDHIVEIWQGPRRVRTLGPRAQAIN